MITLRMNNWELIPIAYNLLVKKRNYPFGAIIIMPDELDEIIAQCDKADSHYILDFDNIIIQDDKTLGKMNLAAKNNIYFYKIPNKESFELQWKHFYPDHRLWHLENGISGFAEDFNSEITTMNVERLYVEEVNDIVDRVTHEWNEFGQESEWQYLVSSNVYSNIYIDIKELFYSHENTLFVVYMLYQKIKNHLNRIDGIVATSKTGSSLGAILAHLCRKEFVYYNIGQTYEEVHCNRCRVSAGKKYIHIFDMMCLGSEAKVLNGLMITQGASLVKSVGIVCLLDLDIIKEKNRYSFLNNVDPLLRNKDLKRDYKIALSKEIKESE